MSKFLDLKNVTDFSVIPELIKERLHLLTPKERKYFLAMWPKSGVLYITSKPGVAKSSISKSLADKMGFRYMDIRLSMVDETDVGLYPNISVIEGSNQKCLDFVVPRWAIEANKQPTIIHFEELNRAQLPVRNAALQILLERTIGTEFAFNETVLMMASGNLGDEDGTDVEEFDSALNNRLIHFPHVLSVEEWINNFAKENCHPLITAFINAYPEKLYQDPTDNIKAYATPRSWRFLSDYIVKNYGKDSELKDFIEPLQEIAHSYIGNGAQRFIQYCHELVDVNIKDIINNYDNIKDNLVKYNRDKKSELVISLREYDIKEFTDKQTTNVTNFLKTIGDDELTAYILRIIDDVDDINHPKIKKFLNQFKDLLVKISELNDPQKNNK
jgi:hypothetical protein